MSLGPQALTIIYSPEAEEVLKSEIEGNKRLELLYQGLEWTLTRIIHQEIYA